jgi:hypothetical protein
VGLSPNASVVSETMARNFPWLAARLGYGTHHSADTHMRLKTVALLLGTLGLAACDNSTDLTVVPNVLTGTFALQTVNSVALPAVVVDSANPALRIDALSGAITIGVNNTFSDITTIRQTLAGVVTTRTVTCSGIYTVVGTVFQFVEATPTADCGRTFTGVVLGTTLNASVLDVPAVFAVPNS